MTVDNWKCLLAEFLEKGENILPQKDLSLEAYVHFWVTACLENKKAVDAELIKFAKQELPGISSPERLVSLYEKASFALRPLIKKRLVAVLEKDSDPEGLLSLWIRAHSGLKELINSRLSVLAEEKLPQISDVGRLTFLSERAPFALMIQIRTRFLQILESIVLGSIPIWFGKMLEEPETIPKSWRPGFRRRVEELSLALS